MWTAGAESEKWLNYARLQLKDYLHIYSWQPAHGAKLVKERAGRDPVWKFHGGASTLSSYAQVDDKTRLKQSCVF